MPNTLQVIARPHALQAPHFVGGVPLGLTLAEIVDEVYDRGHVPTASRRGALVMINGEIVPPEMWARIRPKEAAHITVSVPMRGGGGGGKNPIATILSVIVVAVAYAFGQYYVGPMVSAAFGGASYAAAAGGFAAALSTAALSIAGTMLVNSLFPVRASLSNLSGASNASPTYSVSGASNSANKFSPVPVVLGRHQHTPPLGAQSYTEIVGSDEYLRMLVVWGYGPLKIEDIRIGDTSIDDYDEVEIETREGREDDDPITLFPGQVIQDTTGVTLTQERGWVTRNVATRADEISLDFYFSSGLARIGSNGAIQPYTVEIEIQYRPVNSDTWLGLGTAVAIVETTLTVPQGGWHYVFVDLGSGSIFLSQSESAGVLKIARVYRLAGVAVESYPVDGLTGAVVSRISKTEIRVSAGAYESPSLSLAATDAQVGTVRRTKRWTVSRGDYQVRCRRLTADTDDTQVLDDCIWSAVRVFRNDAPIKFPYPLAMTAIRIKATDQLQSTIRDLNATVTTYAPCYDADTNTWIEAPTQNPAALARLVLTGPANERRRTPEQIDDESFVDFYQFCAANDYRFNMIRDYQASVWDTVSDICTAARAAPTLVDGKWGIIMDRAEKPVTQCFTPRNSWGFSGEKTLADLPHAWRIPFKDEGNGFETDEAFVYADGFTAATATKYETLDLSGLTRFSDVWRQGRYRHAQVRLRPEIYRFNADFEHLLCRRGDRIRVGHDVPMWGTAWGRVKSVVLNEDGALAGVVLDEQVTMAEGKAYGCRFRREDGGGVAFSVVTEEGQTDTLLFQTAVPVAQGPGEGDLAMFGEAERETADLLVSAIRPSSDLTAEIECVDYSPEIYEADHGEIPAWEPHVSAAADVTTLRPARPVITSVQSGTAALIASGGNLRPRILVSISVAGGSPRADKIRLRWRLQGASSWSTVEGAPADSPLIADPVSDGLTYEYQVQAVSIYGVESLWTETATETVVGQGEAPPNVTGYHVNIADGTAYHAWDTNGTIDLSHARIRWSPLLTGATWAESVDIVERISAPATSITTPVLIGTYLIKWVDLAGNESETAAVATTGVASVSGLNFIEQIAEGPDNWGGTFEDTAYRPDMGGLALAGAALPISTRGGDSILTRSGDALAARAARGIVSPGVYTLPNVLDLEEPFTVRLTVSLTVRGYDFGSAFSILTRNGDTLVARDGGILIGSDPSNVSDGAWSVSVEMSRTLDDPAAESAAWSDWQPFVVGDYSLRGLRLRLRLTGSPPYVTPVVQRAIVTVDMPDRDYPFHVDVPVDGARVEFDPEFYVAPVIGLSIADGQEGDAYTLTDLAEGGVTINFTNGGSPVARSVSGIAKSYGARVNG